MGFVVRWACAELKPRGRGARAGFLIPKRRGEWIMRSILLQQLGEPGLNLEFSKSSEFCARSVPEHGGR